MRPCWALQDNSRCGPTAASMPTILVVVCREMDGRFSITIRQHARLRELIEAIPEEDWTPVPYWMDGGADVSRDLLHSLPGRARSHPSAAHRPAAEAHDRFPIGPLRQLQLSAASSPTGAGKPWYWRPTIGPPRPDRECHPRPSSTASASTISPRAASPPTAPGWPSRCWPITWPAGPRCIGLDEGVVTTRSPSGGASSPWPDGSRSARRLSYRCICHRAGLGKPSSLAPWLDMRALPLPA